jgi:hypothetical protein
MQFLVLFYDMSALVVPFRSSVLFVNHLNKRNYKIQKGFPRLYIACTCSGLLLHAFSQLGDSWECLLNTTCLTVNIR